MEKLIELLNKYDEGGNWRKIHWIGLGCEDRDTMGYKDKVLSYEQDEIIAYLISREYGFIKWLVDNDKIELPTSCAIDKNNDYSEREIKSDYESLLMLLAISEQPLEDLISYLK